METTNHYFKMLAVATGLALCCVAAKGDDAALVRILPDPSLTPGKADTMDMNIICHQSTKARRNVTQTTKNKVCISYGLHPHCDGQNTYEIDHLISIELGGAESIDNLWPQSRDRKVACNAWDKDRLENKVHEAVCGGKMALEDAQRRIAEDWVTLYNEVMGKSCK